MKSNWNASVHRLIEEHGAPLLAELAAVKPKAVFCWRLRGGIPSRAMRRILANARARGIAIRPDELIGS